MTTDMETLPQSSEGSTQSAHAVGISAPPGNPHSSLHPSPREDWQLPLLALGTQAAELGSYVSLPLAEATRLFRSQRFWGGGKI
jgi:hypothetical protein